MSYADLILNPPRPKSPPRRSLAYPLLFILLLLALVYQQREATRVIQTQDKSIEFLLQVLKDITQPRPAPKPAQSSLNII